MFGCFLNPFVKRPEFSSPSLRKHGGRMNRHALRSSGNFRRVASERRGAVLAVVIDNDDVELSGIVLFGKRIDALRDGFGFVACRNNHGDMRPVAERLRYDIAFVQLPEISSREKQVNPDRERNRGDKSRRQRHALFCNKPGRKGYARSSARMGSRRIGLPVAAKMALHTAGAIGGVPGSPTPPGASPLSIICTSALGASLMRTMS